MRILFIHQNFPGQWLHLAKHYRDEPGHEVVALTDARNRQPDIVRTIRYHFQESAVPRGPAIALHFTQKLARAEAVAKAALDLKRQGFEPDLIAAHAGWGETLLLREVWPRARQLVYSEFYYRTDGADVDFDPEFDSPNEWMRLAIHARNIVMHSALSDADRGLAPTQWQASGFPEALRQRIDVIHDGIDTDQIAPDPAAYIALASKGIQLRPGDEVVTFVNRNLEPYRGFHVFMRALARIQAERPKARVIIVGGDGVSYGRAAPPGKTWRQIFLDETKDRLDLSRIHFVGHVSRPTFTHMLQVSAAHVYLTYPFVLSWSMIEAMAAGCLLIGSRTRPVEEVLRHGENGLLVDFFDTEKLAETVIDALARPDDYREMRMAARCLAVAQFDLKRVCLPALTALFRRVAGREPAVALPQQAFSSVSGDIVPVLNCREAAINRSQGMIH